MEIYEVRELLPSHKEAIFDLWNSEYPKELIFTDLYAFESYLAGLVQKKHYLVLDQAGKLLGWMFIFEREHETWFAMILSKEIQGKGLGAALLNRAQKAVTRLNAWVIDHASCRKQNGKPYRSPLGFYLKNGFTLCPQQRLETEKISAVKLCWNQT